MEYRIMRRKNEKFIEDINLVSFNAKHIWLIEKESLDVQLQKIRTSVALQKESENRRIQSMLENEKQKLNDQMKHAIENKELQIDAEATSFRDNINQRLKTIFPGNLTVWSMSFSNAASCLDCRICLQARFRVVRLSDCIPFNRKYSL